MKQYKTALHGLLCAVFFMSITGCQSSKPEAMQPEYINQAPQAAIMQQPGAESSLTDSVRTVIPAVVGIQTQHASGNETIEGIGSGFIVDRSGYVITNDHVAGGQLQALTAVFYDGSEAAGTTLWTDPVLDLAVVKLEGENLPVVRLGESEMLEVGQPVAAVGTPLGMQFQHTVTAGIISALNRTVSIPTGLGENFMEGLIQTDASINPGNSGGPLIDYNGNVVGVNTVKVTSAEGIGFAIPVDVIKPIVEQFLAYGSFETPYLGVVGYDREIACYYKKCDELGEGIYVAGLDRGSPADEAGLRTDDIIIELDGEKLTKMWELRKALYAHRVGETVTIRYLRGGVELKAVITLSAKPEPS